MLKLEKKSWVVGFVFLAVMLITAGTFAPAFAADSKTDSDHDGLPNSIEKVYGTNPYAADTDGDGVNDKADDNPVQLENPIKETGNVKPPVKIKDARVEDNFDDNHSDLPDHLQITLSNNGKDDFSSMEIYYTLTDKKTGDQESYYRKLDSTLKSGSELTLHFDNKNEVNHYPGNMNGLYGNSTNGLIFDVYFHIKGYQVINFKIEKDAGGAEVAD